MNPRLVAIRDKARKVAQEQEDAAKKAYEQANPKALAPEPSINVIELLSKSSSDKLNIGDRLEALLEGLEAKQDPMLLLKQACQIIGITLKGYGSIYAENFGGKSQFLLGNYGHVLPFPFSNGANGFDKMLFIDIETYSSVDLTKAGVYRYAASEDFDVTLLAYAYDDGLVKTVDLASGEELPDSLLADLTDPKILKVAHNAQFERICLSNYLHTPEKLDPAQWFCTMVYGFYCGVPGSLEKSGIFLEVENQKMKEGRAGIDLFSKPITRDKQKVRVMPEEEPEQWKTFKAYCQRDVETEREIYQKLLELQPFPLGEWELWQTDQHINDRGVPLDLELLDTVYQASEANKEDLEAQVRAIDESLNVRSKDQLIPWLAARGVNIPDIKEATVKAALTRVAPGSDAAKILDLRLKISKTSTSKFNAFKTCEVGGRVQGSMQFYGAGTGRWAGRRIQPQNFPKPAYKEVDQIRSLLKDQNMEELQNRFDNVKDALISIIRTIIQAQEGKMLAVADYSAIEARVLAWLAEEKWVLDVFENDQDLYCQTATMMYNVPVEKDGLNKELRAKGKIAALACNYGGSTGALAAMGAAKTMTQKQMKELVEAYRNSIPHIVQYWKRTEEAARKAILEKEKVSVGKGVSYEGREEEKGTVTLFCHLPSGRSLVYPHAEVGENGNIVYDKRDVSMTKELRIKKKVEINPETGCARIELYGGRLTENITQAVARDCLAVALNRLEQAKLPVVFHVHDEIIVESEDPEALEKLCAIMAEPIEFCPGLKLKAEGYISEYYKKD